jgi:fructan beta-fructosidase
LVTAAAGVRIIRNPVAELATLRTATTAWTNKNITADPSTDPFAGTAADTYEINAEFDLNGATAGQFGFELHRRANGSNDRAVVYDRAAQTLYGRPLAPINGRVKVRLLVDRGQLEIFGNDGLLAISDNVNFDSSAGSQGIRLFATGGTVRLVSAQLNKLGSAWGRGESTLISNTTGPWNAVGGTWTDVTGGKQGSGTGDAFYLSDRVGTDFGYEADLKVVNGVAAALTFRANATATQHYTANIDTSGLVKLWRPGAVIATYATPIVEGRSYHVKVVAAGSRIRVYLNNGSAPVIDATDTTYTSGLFGANVFNSNALIQNVQVS